MLQKAADGMFGNNGQCVMHIKLLLQKSIKDEFLEKVVSYSQPWIPGNPFDHTLMGSIVDKTQTERIMNYIDTGKSEGAMLNWW